MIDVIWPDVFESFPGIDAFFTLSNRHFSKQSGGIGGLNFGINTTDNLSIIEQNRIFLADALDLVPGSFVIAEQVHKDHIEVVEKPGYFERTDGLITQTPNLVLAIQIADCAAVFVADIENNTIGVFHAGWRGAVANIVSKGVNKMALLAEKPSRFVAYISPCISEKNFEVGSEVASQFPTDFVDYISYKKPHINLKSYLKAELMDAGVNEKYIEVSEECTVDDPQFYSYRRERDRAGRMLACIYMNKTKE